MLAYIKNILPRLQQHSKKLDTLANFVDKQWLFIDEIATSCSYEFLRDGNLVMTIVTSGTNQETQMGTWQLLPSGRLLISRKQGLLALEQGFIGEGVLILKESGTNNPSFCVYDPKIITDGNVEKYLDGFLERAETKEIPYKEIKEWSLYELWENSNKPSYKIIEDEGDEGFGNGLGNFEIDLSKGYYKVRLVVIVIVLIVVSIIVISHFT